MEIRLLVNRIQIKSARQLLASVVSVAILTVGMAGAAFAADENHPMPNPAPAFPAIVASPSLAEILPDSTILYVEVAPWSKWSQDFSNTSLTKIFSEPEVRQFLAGPFSQLSQLLHRTLEGAPKSADADKKTAATEPAQPAQNSNLVTTVCNLMSSAAPGPFALAVRYSPDDAQNKRSPAVAVILGVTTDANIETMSTLLPNVLANILKSVKIETLAVEDYRDGKLLSLTTARQGVRKEIVTLSLFKGRLLACTDKEFCKQLIDGLSGKLEKRLSDNVTYKKTALTGDEHLLAYLDVASLKTALKNSRDAAPKTGTPQPMDEFFALAGLSNSSAVAWSLKMNGPAFESRTVIFSEGEREGLLGILDDAPLSSEALKICPPNTPLAAGVRIQQDKVAGFVRSVIKAVRGQQGLDDFNVLEKQLSKDLGRDLEKELRENFGNEFVLTSLAAENNAPMGQITAFVAALTVKDETKAEEFLTQILTRQAAKIDPKGNAANVLTELEYDGKKIRFITLPRIAGILELSPSFVVTHNRLMMSLDVPTLKRAMKVLKDGQSLPETEPFKKAQALTGGAMGPMFSYVDWAYLYKAGFNVSTTALRLMVPANILREVGINLNLLPSTDSVTQHLFPGLSIARTTANGIALSSRSPLPSLEVVSPPLAAVSAIFASFRPFSTAKEIKEATDPEKK